MELVQIIKWVDDTNWHLETFTEDAREYREDVGYMLEYKQYIYAITEHFLQMDKSNKEAFTRRLFRNIDPFVLRMRLIRDNPENLDGIFEKLEPRATDWVESLIDFIYGDDIICRQIDYALLVDLLKFYCEVIRLCYESDINPVELARPYHTDIINNLVEFLHSGSYEMSKHEKYKSMPRTHRIEAVKLLLQHTGISKGLDRTQIASFVEAVTGGNICAIPKNTESYKSHSKDAEKGAKELLRTLGIEVK